MMVMPGRQGERKALVLQAYREELVERIRRAITSDGIGEAVVIQEVCTFLSINDQRRLYCRNGGVCGKLGFNARKAEKFPTCWRDVYQSEERVDVSLCLFSFSHNFCNTTC
jgi:hypothetical protein